MKLTDKCIERLLPPPPGSRVELSDSKVPGLVVRISDTGVKTFSVRYRHETRTLRYTIGKCGIIDVRSARKTAIAILADVGRGADPMSRKRKGKLSAPRACSCGEAIDRFLIEHVDAGVRASRMKPAYAAELRRLLRREVATKWSSKALSEITRQDLACLLNAIRSDNTRRHTFFAVRSLLKWTAGVGLSEPTTVFDGFPTPAKPNARERVLTDNELKAIWLEASKCSSTFHAIVSLLLLTGQRRDEVADAEWAEFDLQSASWSIPQRRVKNGKKHWVPLAEETLVILRKLPTQCRQHLFRSTRSPNRSFTGWSDAKQSFDAMVGVRGWTLHDLRRTMTTRLAECGVLPHVIERLLNHSSGVISGVSAVYNRATYASEVRAAVELWSGYVSRLAMDVRADLSSVSSVSTHHSYSQPPRSHPIDRMP